MRKWFIGILTLELAASAASFAGSACQEGYGHVTCQKGTVSSVHANGFSTLQGTVVEGHTQVNGSLEADHATLKTLTVNGTASFNDSVLEGEARVNGSLDAVNTQFRSSLTIASNRVDFRKCELQTIVVEKITEPEQKIKLSATHVAGDITFKGGNGLVYLCNHSEITGKVNGGKIIDHC